MPWTCFFFPTAILGMRAGDVKVKTPPVLLHPSRTDIYLSALLQGVREAFRHVLHLTQECGGLVRAPAIGCRT